MPFYKKYHWQFVYTCIFFFFAGCASIQEAEVVDYPVAKKKQGIYHKVGKGETLWRIAQAYGVAIDDIILGNNIPNVAKIEDNQLIFVPGAAAVKEIPSAPVGANSEFIWPLKGKILHYFREPGSSTSNGIDILSQEGEAIRASRQGTVVLADYLSGYGYTAILDHGDGLYSVYANQVELAVKLGDEVAQGKEVGFLGKSKDLAFLHFEIRKKSLPDNPLYYLP